MYPDSGVLQLDKLKIFDKNGTSYVELPRTRDVQTSGEVVCSETTMASGKMVMDIRGFRPAFTTTWEWLPAGLLNRLLPILRQGGYFQVSYPDPTGQDVTAMMRVEESGQRIFKFVDGNPMWYGLTLTCTSQEVVKYGS